MAHHSSWKVMDSLLENFSKEQFMKALSIWNLNSHIVNNRVHSSVVVFKRKLSASLQSEVISNIMTFREDASRLSSQELYLVLEELGVKCSSDNKSSAPEIYVKKLLPKSNKHFSPSIEVVVIDPTEDFALSVGFPVQNGNSLLPKFPYRFSFKSAISLEVPTHLEDTDPSLTWLKNSLLPQLKKWASSSLVQDDSEMMKSHSLIPAEKYTELYQNLKIKYGHQMVKIWPECTDPVKFVYEDVAIASYILLLWGDRKPVSFVDLGCGNGLLVHILNSEGHDGVGIDVRSRKIWELYPETTKLKVLSITPSDSSLFPETEWVIGNHSDELTPWIPVIAARSSQRCKFFVLPCCPYDFDGLKYRRRNSLVSQYSDFLMYVKCISENCGFQTDIDRLRIPSTKRICVVGRDRTYAPEEWVTVNSQINELINNGCRRRAEERDKRTETSFDRANGWVADFKPREAVEKVRNCTRLEEDLVSEIVSITAEHLLIKRRLVPHPTKPEKMWNAGGIIALSEIVPLIRPEKLKRLKSECGGLQTLLKNNHQVFLVEKGKVQLRSPIRLADVVNNAKIHVKQKPCWFDCHHPDGCLLEDAECAYKHEKKVDA